MPYSRLEIAMKIVIATANSHKVREIADKLSGIDGFTFLSMKECCPPMQIDENGRTFTENSLIKARSVCAASGLPAMADDSGLAVDALGGEPGIYSARYGNLPDDRSRYMKVLSLMNGVPNEKRTARFVCVISLVFPDGREFTAEGRCEGFIAKEPAGDHGFGYDPVFIVGNGEKTMAQISLEEKNRISHRAVALDRMSSLLSSLKERE